MVRLTNLVTICPDLIVIIMITVSLWTLGVAEVLRNGTKRWTELVKFG